MNNIQKVEYNGILVLTTQQIAEAYGTNTDVISKNFKNNESRYVEGKHFICLIGEELRKVKANGKIYGLPINANKFYLWTQKGAFLHAKSLNTDTAWELYDKLVDDYFDRQDSKQQTPPLTLQQQIQTIAKGANELYSRMDGLENRFTKFEQELPMLPDDADEVHDFLNKRVVFLLGGKDSSAYHDKSLSKKVFMDAYRVLKYNFNVSRYKAIKRNQKSQALKIISEYKPPLFLAEQIEAANAQQTFEV